MGISIIFKENKISQGGDFMNMNIPSFNYGQVLNNYSNLYNYNNLGSNSKSVSSIFSLFGKNNSASSQLTQSYLTGLKKNAGELKAITKDTLSSKGVFAQKTAVSSNTTALTVKTDNTYELAAKSYEVNVKQAAQTQVNEGFSLKSDNKTNVTSGNNSFAIDVNGKTNFFTVNVKSTDSNKIVQKKMADVINKQSTGVTAKVVEDKATKTSSLVIESKNTGQKNNFEIGQTGTGDIVSSLGADKKTQDSKDAVYNINGGADIKSSSNNITIDKGLTATIKQSASNIKISMGRNTDGIVSSIESMVKGYNELLNTARSNSLDKGAKSVIRQLDGAAKTYQSSLSKVGITINKTSGELQIDSNKLKEAVSSGAAQKALGAGSNNINYGFTAKVSQIATNIDSNTSSYVTSNSSDGYSRNYNAQIEFLNNKASGLGLLFDTLM